MARIPRRQRPTTERIPHGRAIAALAVVLDLAAPAAAQPVERPAEIAPIDLALAREFRTAPDAFAGGAAPDDDGFHVVPRILYWRADVDGFVRIGDDDLEEPTRIDVDGDLGMRSTDVWQPGLDVELGNHRLRFDWIPLRFDGDRTLSEEIVFDGVPFPPGIDVESRLDLEVYRAQYDYRLLHGQFGEWRVGPRIDVFSFDAQLKGRSGDLEEEADRKFSSVLPSLASTFEVRLGPAFVAGDVAGAFAGSHRFVFDAAATAGLRLFDRVKLEAGYRWIQIDVRVSPDEGDITIHGPIAALSIEF